MTDICARARQFVHTVIDWKATCVDIKQQRVLHTNSSSIPPNCRLRVAISDLHARVSSSVLFKQNQRIIRTCTERSFSISGSFIRATISGVIMVMCLIYRGLPLCIAFGYIFPRHCGSQVTTVSIWICFSLHFVCKRVVDIVYYQVYANVCRHLWYTVCIDLALFFRIKCIS